MFLLILSNQANATTISGSSAGFFNGTAGIIGWGDPFDPIFSGDEPSSLEYVDGGFSTDNSSPFKIGTLTYNNTHIVNNANAISDANFRIQLVFTEPSSVAPIDLDFDLTIENTENTGGFDIDDKVELVPGFTLDPVITTINGVEYSFDFLGFSDDGINFDLFFTQPENSNSAIDLYANITAVPIPPAIWLFITAITGVFMSGRRRVA